MIGHIEGVEAGASIGLQRIRPLFGIDGRAILLDIGHLPEAADKAADLRPGARRVRSGGVFIIMIPWMGQRAAL